MSLYSLTCWNVTPPLRPAAAAASVTAMLSDCRLSRASVTERLSTRERRSVDYGGDIALHQLCFAPAGDADALLVAAPQSQRSWAAENDPRGMPPLHLLHRAVLRAAPAAGAEPSAVLGACLPCWRRRRWREATPAGYLAGLDPRHAPLPIQAHRRPARRTQPAAAGGVAGGATLADAAGQLRRVLRCRPDAEGGGDGRRRHPLRQTPASPTSARR
jgi:hypothetical protein